MPSNVISIDRRRIEYALAGTGSPAVVLINGSGGPIEGWYKVFDSLANETATLAYNRWGIGRSSKPDKPQTVSVMVDDLIRLLEALSLQPPYVLVGHSFGGLIANLFARLHPGMVWGVVFLEATAPADVGSLKSHENRLQRVLASVANRIAPLNANHETLHAESSVVQLQRAGGFPHVPLGVITGGRPAMAWATDRRLLALRAKHQRELSSLSPMGRQIIAGQSGHFPQISQPALVVDEICHVIHATCQGPNVA